MNILPDLFGFLAAILLSLALLILIVTALLPPSKRRKVLKSVARKFII